VGPADPLADAPDWAIEFLRIARVGRLATADAAGRPLAVPVCYVLHGALAYSAVDAKPKRTRNLRRLRNVAENPHVSLVVDDWHEDWGRLRWVILEGTGSVLERGSEFTRAIDALREKYPQYRAMNLSRESGAVIRIAPARILAWRAS
jgi:PPOX class probable F420-dependent enzyme